MYYLTLRSNFKNLISLKKNPSLINNTETQKNGKKTNTHLAKESK